MKHSCNVAQYEKFEKEKQQPFYDLLHLLHPTKAPRVLDIGCGNGLLTRKIHDKLQASQTVGIDPSYEMLQKAYPRGTTQLSFKEQDIQSFTSTKPFDIIISNAVLQSVPDHHVLFAKITTLLAPGGQLLLQMPANQSYPTDIIAKQLAAEEPFCKYLEKTAPMEQLLEMEEYAKLLDQLGFENQTVRLQLYVHFLESTLSLLEWKKGSLLTYYQTHLSAVLFEQFIKEYQKRLIQVLGWSEPFFFPMKRLLLWAQLPFHD
jgi:trans-aconitate 2-methyltransferase